MSVNRSLTSAFYTEEEHYNWQKLYKTQVDLLQNRVFDGFWELLDKLALPEDHVPQLFEVSRTLEKNVGWSIVSVNTGIDFLEYMKLISERKLPSTKFLRKSNEFSKDPDVFHELFGHCPLLLDKRHANFIQKIAKISIQSPPKVQVLLKRLFWFTIEVGILKTNSGFKAYGASLISSPKELIYSTTDSDFEKKAFHLLDIFRTPYRSDEIQKTYYHMESLERLYSIDLTENNLANIASSGIFLGEYPSEFKVQNNKYVSVNFS